MKNFNWDGFINGNIAVHCNTKEKSDNFLKECEKIAQVDYNEWYFDRENTFYKYKIIVDENGDFENYIISSKDNIIEWDIEEDFTLNNIEPFYLRKEEPKEMSLEEIESILGYKVKIVSHETL